MFRPVFPEISHRIREDRRGVLAGVSAVAPDVLDFIAGKLERAFHGLIRHPPVTAVDVEVVGAVLKKDANRFRLVLADEIGYRSHREDRRRCRSS